MIRPSLRRLLPWFVSAAVVGVVFYKLKLDPLPVMAHQVEQGLIVGEVLGTGTLEARVKTTISARIQERLLEVMVDQGDSVKKGQLLARLDSAESQQQVAIAKASLAAAKQTAGRVGADLARSGAVLAQAELEHQRLKGLLVSKAVSQADADKAAEGLRIAEADLKRSHAAIAEAESQILVAEQTLLFRQEQLTFTELHSPYDGLVIRRDRDPGDVLVPGASLMQIISLDEIWVSAWVDEIAMPALAANQPTRVIFRSEPARSYPGTVSRLGRETDRETHEFLVEVRLLEMPEHWTIGQRAEVFIETGRQAGAVLLPVAFLAVNQGRPGVFTHQNGKARWQELTLGLRGGERVAAASGLNAGATVVSLPDDSKTLLREGQRIALP